MTTRLRLLLTAALVLIVCPALAGDKLVSPRSAPEKLPANNRHVKAYMEGFEGAFPPVGWTQTVTNAGFTWMQDSFSPFEGSLYALVQWDFSQNERLSFDHFIDSSINEDHLVFATAGNTFWAVNANFTVEVDGTEVYNFLNEFTAGAFVWDLVSIDLTAYDQQTVTIEFIYEGGDGADQLLDAVEVGEAFVPPPPPANDTCAGVIDLQDQSLITFDVDLCLATNTFSPGDFGTSCTGFDAAGNDVVYSIDLEAGETFMATEDGAGDLSMYMVTDCADPVNTCVAGSDNCCAGAQEVVSFVAPSAGTYYLIVDAFSGCGVVTVTIQNPITTVNSSWGAVKAAFE